MKQHSKLFVNLIFVLAVLAIAGVLFALRAAHATGSTLEAELIYGDANTVQKFSLDNDATYDVDTGYYTVHIQIKAAVRAIGGTRSRTAIAASVLAQAFLPGLPGKILHPAQGNPVLGQTARISGMVCEAAFPSGGEVMGSIKQVGHDEAPWHGVAAMSGVRRTCQKVGRA